MCWMSFLEEIWSQPVSGLLSFLLNRLFIRSMQLFVDRKRGFVRPRIAINIDQSLMKPAIFPSNIGLRHISPLSWLQLHARNQKNPMMGSMRTFVTDWRIVRTVRGQKNFGVKKKSGSKNNLSRISDNLLACGAHLPRSILKIYIDVRYICYKRMVRFWAKLVPNFDVIKTLTS